MLARLLRLVLAIEATFYVLLGAWLQATGAAGPGTTLILAVTLALLGRSSYLSTAFALARRHDPMRAPRLGPLRSARLFLRELAAFAWTHTIAQPFLPWTRRRLPQSVNSGDGPPVLFVHGYCCNEGFWIATRQALFRRGIRRQGGISLEPVFGSIDEYAEPLHERVEALCRQFEASRIVIVAHSMGGLAVRAYMRRFGSARVAHLVTVGTPHHGSALARLVMGRNARQMEPGNPWLSALNAVPAASGVPVTAILSRHDEMVSPRGHAALDGARVVRLEGVGHLALGFSPAVRGHIYRVLADTREWADDTASVRRAV